LTESGQHVVIEYGLRRAIVSVAVITATLLEIIDTTIVNVALPTFRAISAFRSIRPPGS